MIAGLLPALNPAPTCRQVLEISTMESDVDVDAASALAEVAASPSAISLIPPLVVLVFAIWLRRPILALVIGSIAGLLLYSPTNSLATFADTTLTVMQDE